MEAWNALAYCFWKKGDVRQARTCYEGALDRGKSRATLRDLSMLLRDARLVEGGGGEKKKSDTKKMSTIAVDEAKRANLSRSVDCAKRAVALDVNDGRSWYYLGNAYLAFFFNASCKTEDIHRALKAYAAAESKGEGARNPDLHFNRGNVFKFMERFDEAAVSYRKAAALDPSLPAETALADMRRRFVKVESVIRKGGRIKAKRLDALVESLPTDALVAHPSKKFCDVVRFADCVNGRNPGKAVHVKCILVARSGEEPPATLIVADASKTVRAISVYNLTLDAVAHISKAAYLTLIEPTLSRVSFDKASYANAQITDPRLLLVCGKPIPTNERPMPALKTETFD